MRILHTESSTGWGGQEIRILKEAEGMRGRGYEVCFVVKTGGQLVERARAAGFRVYELPFCRWRPFCTLYPLWRLIRKERIDIVNTHSSLDAWMGGIAARLAGRPVIRTRHLSTPIRPGLNSVLLYNKLADFVATTSSVIIPRIIAQSGISPTQIACVPTGIDPSKIVRDPAKTAAFRASLGVGATDILIGTVCVVRSWKGILDLLGAARLLKDRKDIKWVIIGGGYLDQYVPKVKEWGLESNVTFTGHLEDPFYAIDALDIFTLLSTAHEGISQASLQAAYLRKPLITTSVGGLPEVCLHERTGLVIPPASPSALVEAVLKLSQENRLRHQWGEAAHQLVNERFLFEQTLDAMQNIYTQLSLS